MLCALCLSLLVVLGSTLETSAQRRVLLSEMPSAERDRILREYLEEIFYNPQYKHYWELIRGAGEWRKREDGLWDPIFVLKDSIDGIAIDEKPKFRNYADLLLTGSNNPAELHVYIVRVLHRDPAEAELTRQSYIIVSNDTGSVVGIFSSVAGDEGYVTPDIPHREYYLGRDGKVTIKILPETIRPRIIPKKD